RCRGRASSRAPWCVRSVVDRPDSSPAPRSRPRERHGRAGPMRRPSVGKVGQRRSAIRPVGWGQMRNGRAPLLELPGRPRGRRGRASAWPRLLSIVLALRRGIGGAVVLRVGDAAAVSCPAPPSTRTRICNGTVAPSSGTTSTTFVFSVTYQDTGNRIPYFVQVLIDGGAPIDMAPAGPVDLVN